MGLNIRVHFAIADREHSDSASCLNRSPTVVVLHLRSTGAPTDEVIATLSAGMNKLSRSYRSMRIRRPSLRIQEAV